jgi:predicted CopG family antitoxin
MVKKLLIDLSDEEYEALKKLKHNKTWKEFLLDPLKKTDDAKIEAINRYFGALERETDIKPEVIEYMRVIAIQFQKGKNGAAVRLLRELAQQREGDEK